MENTLLKVLKCVAVSGDAANALINARAEGQPAPVVRLLEKSLALSSDALASDADWRAAQSGFMELVRARTLTGRIPGWRRAAFETPALQSTVAPIAGFVGENQAVPISTADLAPVKLTPTKIATILLVTDEVAKGTGPTLEAALSADLTAAIAAAESAALIDPTNAGVPDVSPASLTHGIAPITSTGNPANDLAALVGAFAGDLDRAVLITHPAVAMQLHARGYEGAGARGGDVAGIPLFTSASVPSANGASLMVLIDPARVLVADEGVTVDATTQAAVRVTNGSGPAEMISLWQLNLTGFLATRRVGWKAATGAVAYVSGINYGA